MEMLLTGTAVDAAEALRLGLVNRVVAPDALDGASWDLAVAIAAKSSLTVATGKEAFYRQIELDLDAAYAYASKVMTSNMMAHDAAEGIDAFLEKRPPKWEGR
jgi:enoyl-CoA hydratase/carnithine racemase